MYSDSREYLLDELQHLELLIHLQVLELQQIQQTNPLGGFRGLVVSEAEIDLLLNNELPSRVEDEHSNLLEGKIQEVKVKLLSLESRIREKLAASIGAGVYLTLVRLSQIYNLTSFEQQCIIMCLAVEIDRKYEKLYAYLQDDVTQKGPCIDLILRLFCNNAQERLAARGFFAPQATLLKHGLLEITSSSPGVYAPLISRFLRLNDRIIDFLLELGQVEAQLKPVTRLVLPRPDKSGEVLGVETGDRIKEFLNSHFCETSSAKEDVILYFHGPYGVGKNQLAETVCNGLNLKLLMGDVGKMLNSPVPFAELMRGLGREAVLQEAVLGLSNFDLLLGDGANYQSQLKTVFEVLQSNSRLTFLLGRRTWRPEEMLKGSIFIEVGLDVPEISARKHIWEQLVQARLGTSSQDTSSVDTVSTDTVSTNTVSTDTQLDCEILAAKFHFTPGQIRDALNIAEQRAYWRSAKDKRFDMNDLYVACRTVSNQKLGMLARKVKPGYAWEDIILPPEQLEQLQEICDQVKYRQLVYDNWGFDGKLPYGKGLNILFSGPPGTGKTMAAQVIAGELQLDLYKIDLAQIVSKYIGETEKNLERIFQEAETSNAILFFDEADALFGKRSEVKDAHDRYANVETAYLLQKMEDYDGLTILATNLRKNLDEAFVRRMRVIMEFTFPEEAQRAKIWGQMIPAGTPVSEDLDLGFLANNFKLSGGNIKNIVLAAAFLAAGESRVLGMEHLIRATRREMQKTGKLCLKEDFGDYYHWIN